MEVATSRKVRGRSVFAGLLLGVVIALLAAVSCRPTRADTGTTIEMEQYRAIYAVLSDQAFSPSEATARQGDRVLIRVVVRGDRGHQLSLRMPDGAILWSEVNAEPGLEKPVWFQARQAGIYRLLGSDPGSGQLKVNVSPGSPASIGS